MSNDLRSHLTQSMKDAMKAKEKARLTIIRTMLSAIKQIEIDSQKKIEDDAEILPILDKMLKQRRDSEKQYLEADRPELAEQEAYEMSVIKEFLPQPLSEEEIIAILDEAIAQTGAASMQDMGKVMGMIKPKMQGRADMGSVSKLIKQKLS